MATYRRTTDSVQRRRAIARAQQRRLRRLGGLAAALAVVLASTGAAVLAQGASTGGAALAAPPPSPAATLAVTCPSPALGGTLPARVYLPTGYSTSSGRYPVVYFLHGLPANPTSYEYNGFVARAIQADRKSAIVVTPQGARTPGSDREYLNWGAKENWPQAISRDLVACIDGRYRTIAQRGGRALIGLSAGGYGAFNIGLRQLGLFGAVESWSGYFAATNPQGTEVLNLGSWKANAAAAVPSDTELASDLTRLPTYIAFYVGAQDPHFVDDNRTLDTHFTKDGIRHTFAIYPGGHTYALWNQQAKAWLGDAIDYLAASRRHPPGGPTGPSGASGTSGAAGSPGAARDARADGARADAGRAAAAAASRAADSDADADADAAAADAADHQAARLTAGLPGIA